jgi:hypothetical protein
VLYGSLHGTVVLPILDSLMITVRRQQYRHNIVVYGSLQGTVVLPVLDSTMSTVRRQQYRHNIVLYGSLQGTAVLPVLDSTMSTVRRHNYRPNGSTSKTPSKITMLNTTLQHNNLRSNQHIFKLTNKESTVLWVTKEEE